MTVISTWASIYLKQNMDILNNFYTFVANIFLLQTFLYEYTFNTPSWSISAEFYTYIIFAFLFYFRNDVEALNISVTF